MRTRLFSTTAVIAAGTLTLGIAVAGSAAGSAGALPCAKTAKIIAHQGSGTVQFYDQHHTSGATLHGSTLTRTHAYRLEGEHITLLFGSNHFKVSNGSIVALGCSGDAAGDRAVMPMLRTLVGTITVTTTATRHGSVATEEGLFGMVAGNHTPLHYTVKRITTKKSLSSIDIAKWFGDYVSQPNGTSTVKSTNRPKMNVTPYVGPHRGTCRAVRAAKLVTSGNYGHGTAHYTFS